MYRKKVQGSGVQGSKVKKQKTSEHGTRNPEPGIDDLMGMKFEDFCYGSGDNGCYGLAMEVCKRFGTPLPEYRSLALELADHEKINNFLPRFREVKKPDPGDLVLIRSVEGNEYHSAVIVERGWFLHATRENNVHKVRLNHPLYKSRIEGIYRHVGL